MKPKFGFGTCQHCDKDFEEGDFIVTLKVKQIKKHTVNDDSLVGGHYEYLVNISCKTFHASCLSEYVKRNY